MDLGSKFVYLGNGEEDEEEVNVTEINDIVLSDSDCSDDDGETCLLDIFDTAGQEEYSSLKDQYVKSGDGFVIVYSIKDQQSFTEAKSIFKWLERVREDSIHCVLVANKQDLNDEAIITQKQGQDLASKLNVPFFETSAKTGEGIDNAMKGLVRIIPRCGSDYKIVMLGSGAVGKSSITLRFVSDTFIDDYDPTIEDSYRKMISVNGLTGASKDMLKAKKLKKRKGTEGAAPHLPPPSAPEVRKVKQRMMDGNVMLITLKTLKDDPNLVTGDAIKCGQCLAVLTSTAVLQGHGEKKTWNCEFCGHSNTDLEIEEDEVPKGECLDYMLSPATKPKSEEMEWEEAKEVKKETTPGIIVYCMDISSSMQANCEIPESHVAWREERTHGSETINRVSRLDCIQKAVERLAKQLKLEQPEKQVLLTVFSSSVYVKGGGNADHLPEFHNLESTSFEALLEMGLNLSNDYPLKTISESYDGIAEAVKRLRTTGCTALGPALSICTGYVSKLPSSEIVLCTDGEPNAGIGSLFGGGRNNEFYEMIGNYARSKNITINILAVEGASVGLESVSAAAENSGGITSKLNPMEIVRQLRTIAQNEVIATSATVRFFLHPDFVFDEPDYSENLSQIEKEVGNVRKETDLTFRFKLRDPTKQMNLQSVPFQVQITYTRPDGMVCFRVLSKSNEATKSRNEMEKNINVAVLGVSAMKSTAKLAKTGKAVEAQHMLKNMKRLVHRGAKSSKQREERLALENETETWDCELTYNNVAFGAKGQSDKSSHMVHQAMQFNSSRPQGSRNKMDLAKSRKMIASSRKSYYEYKDSH